MSDKSQNGELTDLELARRIRDLETEINPERDLWQGIQRQILDAPQPRARQARDWMPYGVAASLLVASAALVLNLMQQPAQQAAPLQDVAYGEIAGEYVLARNPMMDRFDRVNAGLQEETRQDLLHNLDILKQARLDLERELRLDPGNQRARQMLIRVHEQELALLKQDYLAPARSL